MAELTAPPPQEAAVKRIAAYCRVSTSKESQLDSLANQKAFFIQYARQTCQELVEIYADEGISGTSLKKRDAFHRLMHDARLGRFQSVVVKDISRLARNTVDFLVSIRQLKDMGINTVFLTANMDAMGDSEFVLTLFSAMAQEESGNLSRRVKFGKKINAEKGRVPQRIFGYDRIDNYTLAINPEEAAVVREIFSLYCDGGLGCRSIGSILNREGRKTKLDCQWNPGGVRRILTNPIYQGILVNHKCEVRDYLTGKQVSLPPEEQFFHLRPQWAIVTTEQFQRAQEVLEARRQDSGKASRYSGKHLFSTLIRCAHCGKSFVRKTYTYASTRVYWHCISNDQGAGCRNNVSVNEPELLLALGTYLGTRIPDTEAFTDEVLAQLEPRLSGTEDPRKVRRKQEGKRRQLLAKRARYQELYASELLTLPELQEKLGRITTLLGDLDREAEQAKAAADRTQWTEVFKARIRGVLSLETVTNADLRRLLDRITVDKEGRVQIFLKAFAPEGDLP